MVWLFKYIPGLSFPDGVVYFTRYFYYIFAMDHISKNTIYSTKPSTSETATKVNHVTIIQPLWPYYSVAREVASSWFKLG